MHCCCVIVFGVHQFVSVLTCLYMRLHAFSCCSTGVLFCLLPFGSSPKRCIFFQSKGPLLKFLYLNHCCCCWFWEGDLTGMPRQFSGHKLELNRREKKINIADARPWFLWHQYSFYDGQAPELECTVWLSERTSSVCQPFFSFFCCNFEYCPILTCFSDKTRFEKGSVLS